MRVIPQRRALLYPAAGAFFLAGTLQAGLVTTVKGSGQVEPGTFALVIVAFIALLVMRLSQRSHAHRAAQAPWSKPGKAARKKA